MKKQKSPKKLKIIYTVLMIVFAVIFIFCAVYLFRYFMENKKSEDNYEELRDLIDEPSEETAEDGSIEEPQYVNIDGVDVLKKYSKLYQKNKDFVGWIKIPGTKIDYPVMQTKDDDEYYIRRDFDKKESSAGTLFIDGNDNLNPPSDNIIIYGHNMKIGTMFHDLLEYESKEFFEENKYITFDTIYETGTYEVIAAFRTKAYDENYQGFKYYQFFDAQTEEEFDNFVSNCQSQTPYDTGNTAVFGDKLITLSTCAYHDENGRYVVVAKKIK